MEKEIFKIKMDDAPLSYLRAGRGNIYELVNQKVGAKNVDVHVNHLYPHKPVLPMHHHNYTENIYIVLSGNVSVKTPKGEYHASAGECVFIPPGLRHTTFNGGDQEAVVIEIYAPGGAREKDFIEGQ